MPPEGVGRFGRAPRQVFPEGGLLAQGLTRLDLAGLVPFGLGDLAGGGQDFSGLSGRDEPGVGHPPPAAGSPAEDAIVARFARAWEPADLDALVALLTDGGGPAGDLQQAVKTPAATQHRSQNAR
jgi:hypothetical protein